MTIDIPDSVSFYGYFLLYTVITILVLNDTFFDYLRKKLKLHIVKFIWLIGILDKCLDLVDKFKHIVAIFPFVIFAGSIYLHNLDTLANTAVSIKDSQIIATPTNSTSKLRTVESKRIPTDLTLIDAYLMLIYKDRNRIDVDSNNSTASTVTQINPKE